MKVTRFCTARESEFDEGWLPTAVLQLFARVETRKEPTGRRFLGACMIFIPFADELYPARPLLQAVSRSRRAARRHRGLGHQPTVQCIKLHPRTTHLPDRSRMCVVKKTGETKESRIDCPEVRQRSMCVDKGCRPLCTVVRLRIPVGGGIKTDDTRHTEHGVREHSSTTNFSLSQRTVHQLDAIWYYYYVHYIQ